MAWWLTVHAEKLGLKKPRMRCRNTSLPPSSSMRFTQPPELVVKNLRAEQAISSGISILSKNLQLGTFRGTD